jgi:hypothetical protein
MYRFVHTILRHAADAGRLEPHLAAPAHHRVAAAAAGDRGRAASWAERAAVAAMLALAYEEAVRLYRGGRPPRKAS